MGVTMKNCTANRYFIGGRDQILGGWAFRRMVLGYEAQNVLIGSALPRVTNLLIVSRAIVVVGPI